jgi:hypothetical protein
MFKKIKNWITFKLFKWQLKSVLEDGKDYSSLKNNSTKDERERELYAFLEANSDRFKALFDYQAKQQHAHLMMDIKSAYEHYNPIKFREYLELKMKSVQPKRTLDSIFDSSNKKVKNKNYKKAGKLSDDIEWYLKTDKELRKNHDLSLHLENEKLNVDIEEIMSILSEHGITKTEK